MGYAEGLTETTERIRNDQTWKHLSNKIRRHLDYNPEYKINAHESMLT